MPDVPLPKIPAKFSLTSEFRLLVACSWIAPPGLEQEQSEKIASLCRGGIDWKVFLVLVRRHGIPALAYATLGRYAGDGLPQEVREALQERNSAARHQALFQAAELVRLVKLFRGQGIELIPLKGVFLSHQLYGDLGMRSSGDLDILVKVVHIALAVKILEEEGYHCGFHWHELTKRQQQHFRDNIHHFDFVHNKSGLHVELHWNLGWWLPGQMQALLHHTTQSEWHGVSVNCLDGDATLLMLCDHGSRHEWCSLKWLGEVALLLSAERPAGWETLLALAAEVDLQRILVQSTLLAHWVYGITLPHELCILIQQESLAASLSERALTTLQMNSMELASIRKHGQSLRAVQNAMRLRPSLPLSTIVKNCLISPDEFQMLQLPSSMFWLYYPLRPILWFWRHFISPRTGVKAISIHNRE